ncbi:MAG: hypothetical protein QXN24_01150 [Candidatus Bathyarchaeia archaeon]
MDQYNSVLNPLSHMLLTAREIDERVGKDLTHIFIPLGSTGTLAGIASISQGSIQRLKSLASSRIGCIAYRASITL